MAPIATATTETDSGILVRRAPAPGSEEVLTFEALAFVAGLSRRFAPRVRQLLERRRESQARYDAGARPDFLQETLDIREDNWTVAPLPADLLDRRVEITGPAEPKMIINGLNSGASAFMADFEDSLSPTWDNVVRGQLALKQAVEGTIRYVDPGTGKVYALGESLATLIVRPRGWHLPEKHLEVDGEPVPAPLFDFGLFFFHNARRLLAQGTGPYFYLPKMQSHLEARLWNDVFLYAQQEFGLPRGSIRATVLIETLPAALEMDEILYELREHSAGLNLGRWDYIFSFIKTVRSDPTLVLPDRSQVTMAQPFLRGCRQLLIRTCHRRGVHAMGGMAAQIPIKNDPEANRSALEKVRVDKSLEVKDGHDGTWVAHPGLVPLAREVFDTILKGPNQIEEKRRAVVVMADDLLRAPQGTRTEEGLRHNIRVGVQYLEAWLRGTGCVPLYNLMEDAATAEISRTQVWQWIHHGASLSDGTPVTPSTFRKILAEEMQRVGAEIGPERFATGRFQEASELFASLSTADACPEFLTLPAYDLLTEIRQTPGGL
ncbi:MAG TPA: malate synthase A [Candidatus Polarisedimenticolia bacterium]|nr:malate synthase A [Candidatus Polarisedimenticolia bacterium]